MTPANIRKLNELSGAFKKLAKDNPKSNMCAIVLLAKQRTITDILMDLVFRPEANDGN